VEINDIVTNNPSELIVIIPDLQPGTYQLEVVTQYAGGSNLLKEPRTTELKKTLP
jgi:hypothetical protein